MIQVLGKELLELCIQFQDCVRSKGGRREDGRTKKGGGRRVGGSKGGGGVIERGSNWSREERESEYGRREGERKKKQRYVIGGDQVREASHPAHHVTGESLPRCLGSGHTLRAVRESGEWLMSPGRSR